MLYYHKSVGMKAEIVLSLSPICSNAIIIYIIHTTSRQEDKAKLCLLTASDKDSKSLWKMEKYT